MRLAGGSSRLAVVITSNVMVRVVIVGLVAGVGCGGLRAAPTMHQQLAVVGEWDKNHGLTAQVDRTTLATGGAVDVEATTIDDTRVLMRGILAEELCFGQTLAFRGGRDRAQATEQAEGYYNGVLYAYQTFESLAEIDATTAWPAPPPTNKLAVIVADRQHVEGECDVSGDHCQQDAWKITVGFCSPIPPIPPTANFLALFLIAPGQPASNRIAVWELTGEPPPD